MHSPPTEICHMWPLYCSQSVCVSCTPLSWCDIIKCFCFFPFTHEASRSRRSSLLLELHRSLDFVFFSFGALQKLPGAVRDVPQDVSEHYCKFKSFLFFPITNMSWGRRWLWSPPSSYLCALIARHWSCISHIFLSLCTYRDMQWRHSSDWSEALSGDRTSLDINGSPHNCACH